MQHSTHARILIDMDGVICDFVSTFMLLYRNGGGIVPDGFEWTHWSAMDDLPSQDVRAEVWRDPNLFWIQKPYKGAIMALEALNDAYDVRIVTALPHMHIKYRSDWVEHYAPFIHRKNQMIFTNDKSLIQADVIIDDHLPHVYNWIRANKGTGVIVDRPWNRDESDYIRRDEYILSVRVAGLWDLVERLGLAWMNKGENDATEDEPVG